MSYPRARAEEGAEASECTKASSRLRAWPLMAGTPGGPRWRFHLPMVLLWLALGTLVAITSVLALQLGVEALYLVVTGWLVGPFFIYWAYRKIRAMAGR